MISFREWFKLRESVNASTLQSWSIAEKEGGKAQKEGKPRTANPYDPVKDKDRHSAWDYGWETVYHMGGEDEDYDGEMDYLYK